MKIFNIKSLAHKPNDKYAHSAILTELTGLKDLFVSEEVIPPERKGSAAHSHSADEEMFLILEGAPTLHHGEKTYELKEGDFLGLKPQDPFLHFLENKTPTEVKYLIIRSNTGRDQVIYADDKKNPIPVLECDRLILRPFSLLDAKEVQRMAGNPKVVAMTANIPYPYLDGMAEEWISKHVDSFNKGLAVNLAMETKKDKALVGCISLMISPQHKRGEIGYWVGEEFWGHGFCTEAAQAIVDYSFNQISLQKITARHIAQNPASGKVMQKVGMTQEGYLRRDNYRNGQWEDMVVYGLLNENFK
ncbi:putative ribosomal N-acetyltransferase YdaF [compost metagenome]